MCALQTLAHILQYRQLDNRLKIECGEELHGLVKTRLLEGSNRRRLTAAGPNNMNAIVVAWLIDDVTRFSKGDSPIADTNQLACIIAKIVGLRKAMQSMGNALHGRPPVTMVGVMRIYIELLLVLGVLGFSYKLTNLRHLTPGDLLLLKEDACQDRYFIWPSALLASCCGCCCCIYCCRCGFFHSSSCFDSETLRLCETLRLSSSPAALFSRSDGHVHAGHVLLHDVHHRFRDLGPARRRL